MTSVTQPAASGFWDELTQYLRDLHAALAPLTDSWDPLLGAGSVWLRAGEGSLHLSADEYRDYHRLLQRARDALAPRGDMSEAVIDSALQKAIFDVVDSPGTRAADVEVRIGQAVNECRSFIEKPSQEYECWLEVGGLATASLPAEFGATRFVLLGNQDIERLADLVRTEHTVDQTQKLDRIERMAVDLLGHPVAIQRVHARDTEAAVSLATRKLSSTLECLNFFADVISYNRHPGGPDGARRPTVLRIGESGPAIALHMALAADGSFWENRQATRLSTFSFKRVRDLPSLAGEAVKRVEALLAHEVRNPVEELLLRAVRWVGRATAAESPKDQVLFSEIALECLTRPGMDRHSKQDLVSLTAAVLDRRHSDGGSIEDEISRLYGIRSELVHDGSREILDSDSAEMYEIALAVTLGVLVSPEVKQVETLGALDELLQSWVNKSRQCPPQLSPQLPPRAGKVAPSGRDDLSMLRQSTRPGMDRAPPPTSVAGF